MVGALRLLALCLLGSIASAQTVFEVEPNGTKAEATAVTLGPFGTLAGSSTGTGVAVGDTTQSSADMFRVRTTPLPPGIYRHSLTITGSCCPQPATSIRGLDQTGIVGVGGTAGTTDVAIQIVGTSPTRSWYGFGRQEEIYYRVTGDPAVFGGYNAYFATTTVTPVTIAPVFESSTPITIETTGQASVDTEVMVFDAQFNPVPGALNDDEFQGPSTQSRLTRSLPSGTYYLALSAASLASDQTAAADDDNVSRPLTDFPDAVVASYPSPVGIAFWNFRIGASNGTHVQIVTSGGPETDVVRWYRFTTAPGAPPIGAPANDACSAATAITPGAYVMGTLTTATHDGSASCDPGGTASKDVWYAFTNPLATTSRCRVETCTTGTSDVLLSAYAGCGGAELACNDDCAGSPCGGPAACLEFLLAPGQATWIRVSDKGLGAFDFTLRLTNDEAFPSNDSCAMPLPIAGLVYYAIENAGATTGLEGQNESLCNSFGTTAIGRDLWYTWTSTRTGTVTVATCGALDDGYSIDAKIAVYLGAGCPSGAAIACNDNTPAPCAAGGLNAQATFTAVCSQTYTIQVGSGPSSALPLSGQFFLASGAASCSTNSSTFCLGDGSSGACPCGNAGAGGNGCASANFASGARLVATGQASLSNDTLVLTALNVPGPTYFLQGDPPPLAGVALGDGLLCLGSIVRLFVVVPSSGVAAYPGAAAPNPISVQGSVTGGTKLYQAWYRSVPGLCGQGNFDLTQGVRLDWGP